MLIPEAQIVGSFDLQLYIAPLSPMLYVLPPPKKKSMSLNAPLKNQLAYGPKLQKLHILSLTQDVEIEHIFAVWAAV